MLIATPKLKTAAGTTPITVAELKAQARIDTTADDTLLALIVATVTELAETWTGLSLITQDWYLYLDRFPYCGSDPIKLARGPVASIQAFEYTDQDGNAATLSSGDYILDNVSRPGFLYPAFNTTWPTAREIPNAVRITSRAGFGAAAGDMPDNIRMALLVMGTTFYDYRTTILPGNFQQIPGFIAARSLLGLNKSYQFVSA